MGYYYGNAGSEKVTGLYEGDSIYGEGGDDWLIGLFGTDTLHGGTGSDLLDGGAQNDWLYGEAGNDTLQGGEGDDDLTGGAGADRLYGGNGRDTFFYESLADMAGDIAYGGNGRDTLDLVLGSGSDSFTAGDPTQATRFGGMTYRSMERFVVDGGAGSDRLVGWKYDDDLEGGDGNDTLTGGYGADSLRGGTGTDSLYGGGDDDLAYGGDGGDDLRGGTGEDNLNGGAGGDRIYGDAGADTLDGDGGADRISGGAGADIIESDSGWDDGTEVDRVYGGSGNDSISVGLGDVANGGRGTDRIELYFVGSSLGETWNFSGAEKTFANGTKVSDFEALIYRGGSGIDKIAGSSRADTLEGGGGNDVLSGGAGDDQLDGEGGSDKLSGGSGDDSLSHSSGSDSLYGGSGNDDFSLGFDDEQTLPYTVTVGGGTGLDTVSFSHFDLGAVVDLKNQGKNDGLAYGKTFSSIEAFSGTSEDDAFYGSDGRDILSGRDGADILQGRGGSDLLTGGDGSDVLTGGSGRDVFDFTGYEEDWRVDTVTDFTSGQDKLRFDLADLGFASKASVKLVNAKAPVAADGGPALLFDTDDHLLWIDTDGRGETDGPALLLVLDGVSKLAVSDFDFV